MRAVLALTALAMASTFVYAFGDALQGSSLGNLDMVLVPLFGMSGYYAFELVMPLVSVFSIFLAVREAYAIGQRKTGGRGPLSPHNTACPCAHGTLKQGL